MKKIILAFILLYNSAAYSQTLPDLSQVKLEKVADFKAAEGTVMQTANYILSTPAVKTNKDWISALQFVYRWMHGTPDYSFSVDEFTTQTTKGNDFLLGIYVACYAKFFLENKAQSKDRKLSKLNAVKLLLTYCENPANNIKLTKQLKKLSEANAKGELEKML